MSDTGRRARYEIQIIGHLAPRRAALFDGMTVTAHDDGTTVLQGPVADQSALHGLIRTLGDLGVPIVSVNPSAPADCTTDLHDPSTTSENPRSTP